MVNNGLISELMKKVVSLNTILHAGINLIGAKIDRRAGQEKFVLQKDGIFLRNNWMKDDAVRR